jgi:hypothetical protein
LAAPGVPGPPGRCGCGCGCGCRWARRAWGPCDVCAKGLILSLGDDASRTVHHGPHRPAMMAPPDSNFTESHEDLPRCMYSVRAMQHNRTAPQLNDLLDAKTPQPQQKDIAYDSITTRQARAVDRMIKPLSQPNVPLQSQASGQPLIRSCSRILTSRVARPSTCNVAPKKKTSNAVLACSKRCAMRCRTSVSTEPVRVFSGTDASQSLTRCTELVNNTVAVPVICSGKRLRQEPIESSGMVAFATRCAERTTVIVAIPPTFSGLVLRWLILGLRRHLCGRGILGYSGDRLLPPSK